MAAAVSSAEPEKLFSYAGTLQPMDAAHVSYANGLAQVLASFESSCTEYSVRVGHLADAMRSHGNRCDVTDGWVRSVGDKFVWADQSAVVPTPTPGGVAGMPREDFWEWLRELVETGQAVFGGLLVAASMHGGKGGQIVIDLPEWLRTVFGVSLRDAREWAGLPGHLNNIKPANLPGSMAKFGLVTSVPIIAYKWVEDFRAYEGSERVAAMVTDAALVLIPVGLSYAAGVGIAALAGLAVFASVPAVVVGGAIVLAGVAVGAGFKWAADKWGLRDKAIGWVEGGLDWAGEQLDAAGDWLAETAERSMAWVDDHVFKPVSDKITGWMQQAWDFIDAAAREFQQRFVAVVSALDAVPTPVWGIVAPGAAVALDGPDMVVTAGNLMTGAGDALQAIWQKILDWSIGRGKVEEQPQEVETPNQPSNAVPTSPEGEGSPTSPPDVRLPSNSADRIRAIIDQLDVTTRERYQYNHDGKGYTYCNIFAHDVAEAYGAPLPSGIEVTPEHSGDDAWLDANEMVKWLRGKLATNAVIVNNQGKEETQPYPKDQQGTYMGWHKCNADEAAALAFQGYLVLVGWENTTGIGHIAVVRPESTAGNIIIAQAGGKEVKGVMQGNNFEQGPLQNGFGQRSPLEYFVYDPERPVEEPT